MMTESELLLINEGNVTKDVVEDREAQDEEVLNEEKENQGPAEEIEPNVVQRLKNEEDTSDSLKSLDGSTLDNEKPDVNTSLDQSNGDSVQTLEANDADDEQSLRQTDEKEKLNNDALSTSDIVAHVDEFNDERTEGHQHEDEQRMLQTQANYNLSSLNYSKGKQSAQDSESETELFESSKCKCEEISRNPKNKTKVCVML